MADEIQVSAPWMHINLDPEGCLQIYESTDFKELAHSFPVNQHFLCLLHSFLFYQLRNLSTSVTWQNV